MELRVSHLILSAALAMSFASPASAQLSDEQASSQAMEWLNACPKMPRTAAEGQACFTAEKELDKMLAQSMSSGMRPLVEATRVFAVSRVATHYILTEQRELGCQHANRWKIDHDKNIANIRASGQADFAQDMIETNANFGEIRDMCVNELGITGVAAPLTPKVVSYTSPTTQTTRPAIWDKTYVQGSSDHPLVKHSSINVCIKDEAGDKNAACESLKQVARHWQNKPGQSISEKMVGYQYEYSAILGQAKLLFDENAPGPFCRKIREASGAIDRARPYFNIGLTDLGEISKKFLVKQDDIHTEMLELCTTLE